MGNSMILKLYKAFLIAVLILSIAALTGCQSVDKILEGSSHACGTIHVEGYVTDSQGDIRIMKLPESWTPEQVQQFCSN